MKRMVPFVLGAVLSMSVTVAQAQVSIGVGGGVTIPLGDFKNAAKTGWHGLGSLGYELPTGGLGIRGDFYYGQHSFKGAASGVSAKWKLLGGLGNLLYSFKSPGGVHPYILGSVGFMNLKATASSGSASVSASETKLTFGGGAGIRFKAGTKGSFFVESRYLTVNTSGNNANFIPITVGLTFGI